MYWLKWHYDVKEIGGEPYKIKPKDKTADSRQPLPVK